MPGHVISQSVTASVRIATRFAREFPGLVLFRVLSKFLRRRGEVLALFVEALKHSCLLRLVLFQVNFQMPPCNEIYSAKVAQKQRAVGGLMWFFVHDDSSGRIGQPRVFSGEMRLHVVLESEEGGKTFGALGANEFVVPRHVLPQFRGVGEKVSAHFVDAIQVARHHGEVTVDVLQEFSLILQTLTAVFALLGEVFF
jgi:hypothetical protein